MKLFDLLKSLNGGAITDPDERNDRTAEPIASEDDRLRLLDELSALLELLDAPGEMPVDTVQAKHDSMERTVDTQPASQSLLNLDAIFDNAVFERTTSDRTTSSAATKEFDDLKNHSEDSTQEQRPTHKQLVRSLLDELLPMLEKALGDRLDQLDNTTLEQWTKVAASANQAPTT